MVLMLLAIVSTRFADVSLARQQQALMSARQAERFQLQSRLELMLTEAIVYAEENPEIDISALHFEPSLEPPHWRANVRFTEIACPAANEEEGEGLRCIEVDAVLSTTGNLRVERTRKAWLDTACGAQWQRE